MSASEEMVQLAETREVCAAELMALRIRSAGIDAQVLDQSFRQEPLPSVRAFAVVRVLVPAGQLEAARRALEEGLPLPEDAEASTGSEDGEGREEEEP